MVSREPRRRAAVRVAGAALALLLVCTQARAVDLYQWTDEHGNVRYTPDPERVPAARRGSLQRLEPGMPAPAPAAPRAPAPRETGKTASEPAPVPREPEITIPPLREADPKTPGSAAQPPSTGAPPPGAAPIRSAPRAAGSGDAAREQELITAIAADEEALKTLIAAEAKADDPSLADSEQLREIARRLPELQAELRALRERRAPPPARP